MAQVGGVWLRHGRTAFCTASGVFVLLALAGTATLWMAIAADMAASPVAIFNGRIRLSRKSSQNTDVSLRST